MDNKVLIGVITQEYARRADFYDYLNLMRKPANSMLIMCHDRSPAKGRNLIIEAAIDQKCTHVLFMDDDMTPRPDALELILENADKSIVSGLYLSRALPHQPLIFDVADEGGACFPAYLYGNESGLIDMVAAGFGFILIRVDALLKLEKPWIRLGELDSQEWCDDIGFFKRAREANLRAYCDTRVRVGHQANMIIWPTLEDGMWYAGYDTNNKGQVNVPITTPKATLRPLSSSGGILARVGD